MRCVKQTNKSTIMLWPTIQQYGCQMHYCVVSITLAHNVTGHSVVSISAMMRAYNNGRNGSCLFVADTPIRGDKGMQMDVLNGLK